MASGALTQIGWVAEVTRGTTPATPAFQLLRDSRFSGGAQSSELTSEAVNASRLTGGVRLGAMSYPWTMPIELAYGAYDAQLASLLTGAWADDALAVGTTRSFASYEIHTSDMAAGAKAYMLRAGTEVFSAELTMATNAIIKGSMGLRSMTETYSTTSTASSTHPAAVTTDPLCVYDLTLTEGVAEIADVTELKLNIAGGGDYEHAFGAGASSREPTGTSIGKLDITGNLTATFNTRSRMEAFRAETETSLTIAANDPAGNDFTILLTRLRYTGNQANVEGAGTIVQSMPFRALGISFTRDAA